MSTISIESQRHPTSHIERDVLLRYNYTTVDWVVANTTLEVEPTDANLLITRTGFVTYNPADDFTQTVKIEFYDSSSWTTLLTAVGYAPLIINSSRIDSFKIGANDMIHISTLHRNGIALYKGSGRKLRFTTSGVINGTDKFYAGCVAVKYR